MTRTRIALELKMSEGNSDSIAMSSSQQAPRRHFVLLCSLVNGTLLSFGVCVVCMRIALGAVDLPGSTFGISAANFQIVNIAAFVLTIPTTIITLIVFYLGRSGRDWWTLAPALLIPALGGCGFLLFLISGLST